MIAVTTATAATAGRLKCAPHRPRAIWSVVTVLVVGALGAGAWYAYTAAQLFSGSMSVPCEKATRFAAAQPLPASARNSECRHGQWLGIHYEAEFRIPREDFEAWLRASYPTAPSPHSCTPLADLCADIDMPADNTPPDSKGIVRRHLADTAKINAWTLPDGSLRVELSAYTV
ncbi:hypothetical protein ACGFX2_33430 [Streptomyces goshikiensis]|uniref:hypothetical protein n=1 Tax=Streptomyces goshikiensis TaxID=1942 RepID=UPI00371C884E